MVNLEFVNTEKRVENTAFIKEFVLDFLEVSLLLPYM